MCNQAILGLLSVLIVVIHLFCSGLGFSARSLLKVINITFSRSPVITSRSLYLSGQNIEE